jgi:polysaccharide export outer membrane protein
MTFTARLQVVLLASLFIATVSAASVASQTAPPAQPQLSARARYALRAGDVITIDYRFTPEFNQTVTIRPDGFVDLTLIGEAHVAGLTLADVHSLVVQKSSVHLKDPEVNISLKEFERPYVVVAGEVDHPGRFDFYEKTTALQAVLQAGGIKISGQQSDVYVFRKVDGALAEVHHISLKNIKRTSDLEHDLTLQPGDMILVPRNKLENIGRFIKTLNLQVYFDPLQYALP